MSFGLTAVFQNLINDIFSVTPPPRFVLVNPDDKDHVCQVL